MSASAKTGGLLGYMSLFTSVGTLLCCALPSLFVLVGLGATVASVVSTAPWLITLSRHKNWTFAIAGALIAANFVYVFHIAPRLQQGGTKLSSGSAERLRRCKPNEPDDFVDLSGNLPGWSFLGIPAWPNSAISWLNKS